MTHSSTTATTVRSAATLKGSTPAVIAILPRIGATPRKSGVNSAAESPCARDEGLTRRTNLARETRRSDRHHHDDFTTGTFLRVVAGTLRPDMSAMCFDDAF